MKNRSKQLFEILELTSDLVSAASPELKIIYLNESGRKLLGWDEKDAALPEKAIKDLHPPWAAEIITGTGIPEAEKSGLWGGDTAVLHKSGREIPVSQVIIAHYSSGGRLHYYSTIMRDITSRTRLEKNLKDRTEQFDFIKKATLDGFIHFSEDGKILDANNSYCRISGYTREELTEMHITDIEAVQSPAEIRKNIEKLMVNGSNLFTSRHRKKNGEIMDVEISTTYWHERGELFAFIRDISGRVEQEKQLRNFTENLESLVNKRTYELQNAKDALEYANRVKTEFLSRMSHELKTPLTAIIGFSQLIGGNSSQPLENGILKDYSREINTAGKHLLSLIDSMLEFSDLSRKLMSIKIEEIKCVPVIEECINIVSPLAGSRKITITSENERVCRIKADRDRLRQILLVFLSNAIKYNSPGGKVEVSCYSTPGGKARLSVKDTGRGIPGHFKSRIFSPFEKFESRNTEEQGGIGIGLAVCKQLIEEMGGTIGFESEENLGSTFWVELDRVRL